ncbi:hypothetical protein [Streptomyces sp. NBC_00829]|uniref:hypothetical protein n=1 Tax=Streptomyces sp. NBC_00829 TaxID=2903679 RepID=UPI00386B219A|nr:hypothetical protein OG293_36045 [Streptomyces sp. NBC_00829]
MSRLCASNAADSRGVHRTTAHRRNAIPPRQLPARATLAGRQRPQLRKHRRTSGPRLLPGSTPNNASNPQAEAHDQGSRHDKIRKSAGGIAALSALIAAIAVPALAETEDADQRTSATGIDWHACADTDFKYMQCGSIQVPVDWAHPHSGRTTLALVRRPADDRAHRQGTLLLNDGAGGSSIEQLRLAMHIGMPNVAGAMTQKFDLVAVDTRPS